MYVTFAIIIVKVINLLWVRQLQIVIKIVVSFLLFLGHPHIPFYELLNDKKIMLF